MMGTALKVTGLFVGLILIFSITINDRPLFLFIYSPISPLTKAAQERVESLFQKTLSKTKSYTKQIFNNSIPKLNSTLTSSEKNKSAETKVMDHITEEDKSQLDDLIKNY